jgi:predicted peroxiredoxin
MAKILYLSTQGSNDAATAALAFVAAKGAVDAGHQATIGLLGEAVWLLKDPVAENVKGVGWPTVKELWSAAITAKIPVYI